MQLNHTQFFEGTNFLCHPSVQNGIQFTIVEDLFHL